MREIDTINEVMASPDGTNVISPYGQDPASRWKSRRILGAVLGLVAVVDVASCSSKTVYPKDHSVRPGIVSAPRTTVNKTPVPGSPSTITEPPCKLNLTEYPYGYASVSTAPITPNPNDSIAKAKYDIYPPGSTTPAQEFDLDGKHYTDVQRYLGDPGHVVTLTIDFKSGAEVVCSATAS